MLRAVADEVSSAHLFQRLTQQRPVVGVVVTQKGLVEPSLTYFFTVLRDWVSRFTRCRGFIPV